MKTAVWLYLFMFVAFFDLHAQYPILSPFAISLGAAPSFIGLIMGMYSVTHLPGNVIAGYGVDRFGSKYFITFSLIAGGVILLLQSRVANPWELLVIRSASGFVLAFLSPACLAMLAKMAKDQVHQGHLMSGNGLVHTLASVVSPAAGAYLVAKLGFTLAFACLGWGLILTGILAAFGIKEIKSPGNAAAQPPQPSASALKAAKAEAGNAPSGSIPWLFYGFPLALSCSQGILFFELPLHASASQSIMSTGILFSLVSLGALTTLSMLFLNKIHPYLRTMIGAIFLALCFFGLAVEQPFSLAVFLFLVGMAKGVMFPALSTLLIRLTEPGRYGRSFSIMSICMSIGAFIGPLLAGTLRGYVSPFYLAFLALMIAAALLPPHQIRPTSAPARIEM